MRLKGLTYQVIGDHFNCSKSAVQQRLKDLLPTVNDLSGYKNNKANIFDAHSLQILSTLTVAQIKKESPRARIQSVKDLNEMARLERSQSTAIVETRSLNISADVSNLFK